MRKIPDRIALSDITPLYSKNVIFFKNVRTILKGFSLKLSLRLFFVSFFNFSHPYIQKLQDIPFSAY